MSRRRLNFVTDPELAAARGQMEAHLEAWVEGLEPLDFCALFDPLMQGVLKRAFDAVGGTEGTVWLSDPEGESLVAVFNSGPKASELVGFKQTLGKGIISLVYSHEQPYCENGIADREAHDDTLDRKLGSQTEAMIATPFYFAYGLRGVISCVQLKSKDGSATGFDASHVEQIAAASSVLERLINGRLISAAMGLDYV